MKLVGRVPSPTTDPKAREFRNCLRKSRAGRKRPPEEHLARCLGLDPDEVRAEALQGCRELARAKLGWNAAVGADK